MSRPEPGAKRVSEPASERAATRGQTFAGLSEEQPPTSGAMATKTRNARL
jgi:hypothetical protein